MARRFFYALFYSEDTVSCPEASRQRAGCLYSPNCLEEVFSETGFPVSGVLGNSVAGVAPFSETEGQSFIALTHQRRRYQVTSPVF